MRRPGSAWMPRVSAPGRVISAVSDLGDDMLEIVAEPPERGKRAGVGEIGAIAGDLLDNDCHAIAYAGELRALQAGVAAWSGGDG
jgi:hypothetical protein